MTAHVLVISDVGMRALEGAGARAPQKHALPQLPLFVHYDLPVRKVRLAAVFWRPTDTRTQCLYGMRTPQKRICAA